MASMSRSLANLDFSAGDDLEDLPIPHRGPSMARSQSDMVSQVGLPRPPMRRTFSVKEVESEMRGVRLPTSCVVQIHATGVDPSYTSPWRVNNQQTWTGSGFCISGKRILTNAHCVENCTVLQIQSQDNPKKWRAHHTSIAHDLDLAIVVVEDDTFWETATTVELAPADHVPALYSEVNAIGFPLGGSTVCVTKGVISRFDAHLYVHPSASGVMSGTKNSPGEVFILQVDSAINPGNSGGPAVSQQGKVVGVASSGRPGSQNVGYVIPVSIVHLFLDEVISTGGWSGVSELGVLWRQLESDAYRAFIGMKEGETGVLVVEVAPLGELNDVILPGDVITHVDGVRCSNEGKVPITIAGQQVFVPIDAIITSKPKGKPTTFTLIRQSATFGDGSTLELKRGGSETVPTEKTVKMAPIAPLAPRFHGIDARPEFVLIGGLIFSRVTIPLLHENIQQYTNRQTQIWIDMDLADSFKRNQGHELVILISILTHDVNIGVPMESRVVDKVDGIPVKSLAHLASIASSLDTDHPGETDPAFVRFTFKKETRVDETPGKLRLPDIVLERSKIPAANAEICEAHAIPHVISPSLLEVRDEDAK